MARESKLRAQATISAGLRAKASTSRRATSTDPDSVAWEIRRELGGIWAQGRDTWPVEQIVGERTVNGEKEYRLQWDPHPVTGARFSPTWEPAENVLDPNLVREWTQSKSLRKERQSPSKQPRARVRRIVESSSDTEASTQGILSGAGQSHSRDDLPSIPETQQLHDPRGHSVFVQISPGPSDLFDYETVYNSSQVGVFDAVSERDEAQPQPTALDSPGFPLVQTDQSINSPARNPLYSQSSVLETPDSETGKARSDLFAQNTGTAIGIEAADSFEPPLLPSPSPTPSDSSQVFIPSPPRSRVPGLSTPFPGDIRHTTSSQHSFRSPLPARGRTKSAAKGLCSSEQILESIESPDKNLLLQTKPQSRLSLLESITPSPQSCSTSSVQHSASTQSPARTSPRKRALFSRALNFEQLSLPSTRPQEATSTQISSSSQHLMATSRDRASPRLRSATPATDSKKPIFEDAVRGIGRASRTENAHGRQSRQPIATPRRPASVMLNEVSPQFVSQHVLLEPQTAKDTAKDDLTESELKTINLTATSENHTMASQVYATAPADVDMSTSPAPDAFPLSNLANSNSTAHSEIQQSVEDDKMVPQSAGNMLPTKPIFEKREYAIWLPAEGKVQALYHDAVKTKRRTVMKFIRRRDSNGIKTPPNSKIAERNEMGLLIDRLNDTVIHLDLAIDDFGTQYSLTPSQIVKYATLAGSKFAFLDAFIDHVQGKSSFVVIFAKPGRVQDLLREFLKAKGVQCDVDSLDSAASSQTSESTSTPPSPLRVLLLTSGMSSMPALPLAPSLIIAFDSSFDAQDPLVRQIRGSEPEDPSVPILHLLILNSSEHCDICIPKSMPSPQRLRLLVRTTYQARKFLGGPPVLDHNQDEFQPDRVIDLAEVNRIWRKSPDRRIQKFAKNVAFALAEGNLSSVFALEDVPDLQLDEIIETPENLDRARTNTPLSRAGTPSGKKRLLDSDSSAHATAKRQRLTPLPDVTHISNSTESTTSHIEALQSEASRLSQEVTAEQEARKLAEAAGDAAQEEVDERSLALRELNHRYEARMRKNHEQARKIKTLQGQIDNRNAIHEQTRTTNATLGERLAEAKKDLVTARDELKNGPPDLATLETAREEARKSTARLKSLETNLKNARDDFEFIRGQYQTASTQAADLAAQVTALEDANNVLAAKASDEKTRLRAYNENTMLNAQAARIAQLEDEKKGLELAVMRLEEEKEALRKASTRSGVQTRGSSVQPPSSPRLAGALMVAAGRSRQASPAPVGVSHALGAVPRVSGLRREA